MKKFALLLANVLAVVGLAVLTIKLFPVPRLNQNQTAWLIDASEFFHFNDTEWFGSLVFGAVYLLAGCLEWFFIRLIFQRVS
ncbi:DUF1158 family protein [Serratia ureilytica]|uniref:DUF1158 family protein n=1 Tax=Serratia ureilytica TaxID=300181 RepID=UPI00313A911F